MYDSILDSSCSDVMQSIKHKWCLTVIVCHHTACDVQEDGDEEQKQKDMAKRRKDVEGHV